MSAPIYTAFGYASTLARLYADPKEPIGSVRIGRFTCSLCGKRRVLYALPLRAAPLEGCRSCVEART